MASNILQQLGLEVWLLEICVKYWIFLLMGCIQHENRAVGSEGTKASRVAGTYSSSSRLLVVDTRTCYATLIVVR